MVWNQSYRFERAGENSLVRVSQTPEKHDRILQLHALLILAIGILHDFLGSLYSCHGDQIPPWVDNITFDRICTGKTTCTTLDHSSCLIKFWGQYSHNRWNMRECEFHTRDTDGRKMLHLSTEIKLRTCVGMSATFLLVTDNKSNERLRTNC